MAALRAKGGMTALAFEFTILTTARTGEAIGTRWSELDLREKVWTIPASRMKAGREHRVPLSGRAVEILEELAKVSDTVATAYVFPGNKRDRSVSSTAFLMLLRRMGRGDLTAHGFRSTFGDWAAELTNFPSEVAEMPLAHPVSSKVEQAYRRGDLFERRRRLMATWAQFCAQPADTRRGSVTRLRNADPRTRGFRPRCSVNLLRIRHPEGAPIEGQITRATCNA
jgi:integrase